LSIFLNPASEGYWFVCNGFSLMRFRFKAGFVDDCQLFGRVWGRFEMDDGLVESVMMMVLRMPARFNL